MSLAAFSVSILVLFSVVLVLLNNSILVKKCVCQGGDTTCYVPDMTDCQKYKFCSAAGEIVGEDSCHFGTYREFSKIMVRLPKFGHFEVFGVEYPAKKLI